MAGLVMCRQGLERRPPAATASRNVSLAKRVNALTVPSRSGWYTERATGARRAAGPLAVRREFAAIIRAAGLGEEWAPQELRHSFLSILSANGVRIEDSATW
jgi:hypothetical protein